jgi:hypothetical protein
MEEIVKREDGSYLMGGLVNADDFIELFSLQKELAGHREYHTLAGIRHGRDGQVPRTGETFVWNGFRFEIVDMDGNGSTKCSSTRRPTGQVPRRTEAAARAAGTMPASTGVWPNAPRREPIASPAAMAPAVPRVLKPMDKAPERFPDRDSDIM